MNTLAPASPAVNSGPVVDPRDVWPAWTDEFRWELGPEPGPAGDDDEPRPTAGPDFEPDPEDVADWLALRFALAAEAEDLAFDAMHAERMEAAFGDPNDLIPHEERVRVLGRRAHA